MGSHIRAPIRSEERGWALTRLIQVHNAMRDDLALLQQVSAAEAAGDGTDAARVLALVIHGRS